MWAFTPATANSCMRPAEAGTFRYRLCQTPIINPVIWGLGRTFDLDGCDRCDGFAGLDGYWRLVQLMSGTLHPDLTQSDDLHIF
jgi:hypothetical protein